MKKRRYNRSGGETASGLLSYPVATALSLVMTLSAQTQVSNFYAYYTRLDYDDRNNTGKYADLVVCVGTTGKFVFSREYSYLPYWQPSQTKYFVDRILPVSGDGSAERPDKINKCSYVRLIENSPDRIVVHWRYAPDLNSVHFTDFRKNYQGDMGRYFADYAEEYFMITAEGQVTRKVKMGCYRLDDWNDPLNVTTQELSLAAAGIVTKKTMPARLQNLRGDAIPADTLRNGGIESPAVWLRFDEGVRPDDDFTQESVKGYKCAIGGVDSYWRKGVSGTCLSFDGYTNEVTVPAGELPDIRGDFTIEAWIAPQEYSWDWSGIVDHDQDKRAGYRLAINHLGQIGLHAYVGGEWQGLITGRTVDLLKWTFVAAVYERAKGFSIYFDGVLAGSQPATGPIQHARDLDLYIGMAHEKSHPWAFERDITRTFRSNMVFSGLIDEVRIFDRALNSSQVHADYEVFKPDILKPLHYWVLPAGPPETKGFGAVYTKLRFSPEWDGLWRVGDHADIVVSFDDRPNRFVFWRGTNYLPSLVTQPGQKGIWVNDQGPENYTNQCFEHMSDKMCRYSHVRLIENTDARVVVHWRNASVSISYEWLQLDKAGWGLWTDEYWYIYPDAVSVRYQVSGRLADFPDTQTQQNELLNPPGTRPEDNVAYDSITISNLDGQTELWDYSVGPTFRKGPPISGEGNLVYMNLRSEYKHFNIGQTGSHWVPYSQWESMRLAPGFSRYNAWNHYPVGLLPSDGTAATGKDRTSSSCLGTLNGLHHLLKDGRMEAYNIYGMTNLPAAGLKTLNRSWNSPAAIGDLNGCQSTGYNKRQRAYPMKRESDRLSFRLNGSEETPILNPCFVIAAWGGQSRAHLEIDGKVQVPGPNFRQGIIRDTDGTQTMIIWVKQESYQPLQYGIY